MSNGKGANGQTMICKTQRAKDSATRTPQKTVNKQGCYGMVSSSGSTSDTRRVTVKRQETSYDMEILLDTSIRK